MEDALDEPVVIDVFTRRIRPDCGTVQRLVPDYVIVPDRAQLCRFVSRNPDRGFGEVAELNRFILFLELL
ncbi:MAG: hypothetical protein JF620_02900 [Mesorhizobium sp.]|nr:hypothetical protein [Mesorhizobium sp.]